MSHDRKYDAPEFVTFICLGCGRDTPNDDRACYVDDICETCFPAAGSCLDCRDARADADADFWQQYIRETPC